MRLAIPRGRLPANWRCLTVRTAIARYVRLLP